MFKLIRIKNSKRFQDMFLSVVASIILTFSTQIIAFPLISRMVSINEYGEILTLSAIMNILAVTFGNTLNNTRLLLSANNIDKDEEKSFNFLFIILLILNSIILLQIFIQFFSVSYLTAVLLALSSNFLLFRAYYTVEYRLFLNYKKILIISLLTLLGYLIGSMIAYYSNEWVYVFYFGELLPIIFIIMNSTLVTSGIDINKSFVKIFKKFMYLVIAAFLISLLTYLDRFIINPFLGAKIVSIFVVSSFLGKTIGILLGPIAGVLLSYYVQEEKVGLKQYYNRILINLFITSVCFILILSFGKSIIKILYPNIFPFTDNYYFIANLGAVLYVFGNLLQPSLLVNTKTHITTFIQVFYFIVYILLAIFLISKYNLTGFCYSIITSNILRIILMIFFTHKGIKRMN